MRVRPTSARQGDCCQDSVSAELQPKIFARDLRLIMETPLSLLIPLTRNLSFSVKICLLAPNQLSN